jgi:hypothetical protein
MSVLASLAVEFVWTSSNVERQSTARHPARAKPTGAVPNGMNPNNNRALMRLRHLLPNLDLDSLLDLVLRNIRIDWVAIDRWVDRCLLEKAGVVNEIPIFDLDAEH